MTEALEAGAALEDFRNPTYSEDSAGAGVVAVPVDPSVPYCDASGDTRAGKGRRPSWLVEAIGAGAAVEDFKNPAYEGA